MLEFAIIGSLALLALSFLIQIGLRVNYQQEIEQQAFRRALASAHAEGQEESQAVTYYQIRNRQTPDPTQGLAVMPRATTEASSTVTWGEWLTYLADDDDSEPRTIVDLNRSTTEFRSSDLIEDEPFIRSIDKEQVIAGEIRITNPGGGFSPSTRLTTTETETTTLTLNTKNTQSVSSTMTTDLTVDW